MNNNYKKLIKLEYKTNRSGGLNRWRDPYQQGYSV